MIAPKAPPIVFLVLIKCSPLSSLLQKITTNLTNPDFARSRRRSKPESLFPLPQHFIVRFAGVCIQPFTPDLKPFSSVKTNRPHILLIHVQAQRRLSVLGTVEQTLPDAVRLRLLRNENALDVFAVQTEKALYPLIRFIHIDFRLRQHFLHGGEIALPVGRGNKSVCFAIGVQPYLGNAVDVCFLQWSNHDGLSENPDSARRQALSGLPR